MSDDKHREIDEEVGRLRIFRGEEEPAPVEPQSEDDPAQTAQLEEYWAGRNHAMRRSARVAA